MNPMGCFWRFSLCAFLIATPAFGATGQVSLGIRGDGAHVNLSAPSAVTGSQGERIFPEYTVEKSSDLEQWTPVGGKVRGIEGVSGAVLNLNLNADSKANFYRVVVSTNSLPDQETGSGGADVFGYNAQLSQELNRLGALSVAAFASNAPQPQYLPQIDWDPTTAQFWTNFNSQPTNVWQKDLRLNADELAIFKTNAFVVSGRLGAVSFDECYYDVFSDDLPIFVSADSVLHAWYRTYGGVLQEMEELEMSTMLETLITNMSTALPDAWQAYGNGPLQDSVLDADFYLTVARSLWAGTTVPSSLGLASQDQRVTTALSAINGLQFQNIDLFGTSRPVDFSQFTVRGHYTNSDRLRRYFRAMMWCGQIDLRLATFFPNKENDARQLGTAVVLNYLLEQSHQYDTWAELEKVTGVFVGETDSMTFAQLKDLLRAENIASPADITSLDMLTNLQTRLLTGELGAQNISDLIYSPLGMGQVKVPRAFTVCGQKFTLDSWALSKVTYDRITWPPGSDNKVMRRRPSGLDIAYSVFGNDQVVPDLVARINNTGGEHWRDGLPYQRNLQALRNVVDAQSAAAWTNNIYGCWLAALRALSVPTVDPKYPEAMRTKAWAMKTLNAQLASWAELRHETVLYVKPSNSDPVLCGYPAGFVEPVPEFWGRMPNMAAVAASVLNTLSVSGTVIGTVQYGTSSSQQAFDLSQIRSNQVAFFYNFADQMTTLQGIAEKELA